MGCGRQAASQVAAMRAALPAIERVIVYCRSTERLAAFCREARLRAGDSARDAAECDIVVTVTTSKRAGRCWASGCTRARSSAASARTSPDRASSTTRCSSALRSSAATRASSREARVGRPDRARRAAESSTGTGSTSCSTSSRALSGRAADDDIVVFKSNGIAAWDIAVALAWSSSPASRQRPRGRAGLQAGALRWRSCRRRRHGRPRGGRAAA